MFSHFFIDFFIFENFDQNAKKNHFLAEILVFWAKNDKIFKNKKLIKKVRKHTLNTCIDMALANIW